MLALVVASTALQGQLLMGFTPPLTRLAFKHLRSLSCQRLGPLATLTTWVSTLYVRLTDSLECQDAIFTWILTKLYNEAPPWTSWNYVLSMRHHHELSLTRVMELRPDHEAPLRNHRGITSWPWGTTTKPSWNYVLTIPKSCLTNQRNIIMHTNLMPIYITNHPFMFRTKIIPNSSNAAHKPSSTCKITQFTL